MTTIELTSGDETEVETFAGRLFEACLGAMELANVELGVRLGLYETHGRCGGDDGRGAGWWGGHRRAVCPGMARAASRRRRGGGR